MSTKTHLIAGGLTALGLFWSTARGAAPDPESPGAPQSPPPSTTVVLLSDGQILRGEVEREENGYAVRQKAGVLHLPKARVDRVFDTMAEAYRYKLSIVPAADADEQLKLARWCLAHEMNDPARERLEAVLALEPKHSQARGMLASLKATAAATATRDQDVVRTSTEVVDAPGVAPAAPEDMPRELSPSDVARTRERRPAAPAGPPVIFDLPPAEATKRFQEFAFYVHPELQRHCAKCHNERVEGQFQLIQARSKRELYDRGVLLNNLDVALRQVNRERPGRSDLLVNSLMPHGKARGPVLSGPNHPSYRAFSTWVARITEATAAPEDGATRPAGFTATDPKAPAGGGFGSERGASARRGQSPAPAKPPAGGLPSLPNGGLPLMTMDGNLPLPAEAKTGPSRGSVSRVVIPDAKHPSVPDDLDFRTVNPVIGNSPYAAPVGAMRAATDGRDPETKAAKTPGSPGAKPTDPELGEIVTREMTLKAKPGKKKPLKLDDKAVEKLMIKP